MPEAACMGCNIVSVGKRRDGGTRYWCLAHRGDATAKYGLKAEKCRFADVPHLRPSEIKELDISEFQGGLALWGAVPPVFDTSEKPIDRGIHVHARKTPDNHKCIDETFRKVILRSSPHDKAEHVISELDAIYYMISSVFGFQMKKVECTKCGYSHLDKDWFSLHPHNRHLCAGCGNYFRDAEIAVGNPLIGVQEVFGHVSYAPESARRELDIRQSDYPGGIQIWGSNPSFFWTGSRPEEEGIHIHAFDENGQLVHDVDNTYSRVMIDGVELNSKFVRMYMAQSILPHLRGRIKSLYCSTCGREHVSENNFAFSPSEFHTCRNCATEFRSRGRTRKIISNPIVDQLTRLAASSPRPPRTFELGLFPETL
jgi:hypothetical protein